MSVMTPCSTTPAGMFVIFEPLGGGGGEGKAGRLGGWGEGSAGGEGETGR